MELEPAQSSTSNANAAKNALQVARIFSENFDFVYRSLIRLGAAKSDAEDLAQEVFLTLFRRMDVFDDSRSIRAWLYGIARNTVRDHLGKAHIRREAFVDAPETSGDTHHDRDMAELLYKALMDIDEPTRSVLILVDLEGFGMKEVAEILGINAATGYSMAQRGREQLKQNVLRRDPQFAKEVRNHG